MPSQLSEIRQSLGKITSNHDPNILLADLRSVRSLLSSSPAIDLSLQAHCVSRLLQCLNQASNDAIQSKAASCLVLCCSTFQSDVIKPHTADLIKSCTFALDSQRKATNSAHRCTHSILRLLAVVFDKHTRSTPANLGSICQQLIYWATYGISAQSSAPKWTSKRVQQSRERRPSAASIATTIYDSASEAESSISATPFDKSKIRVEALECISNLAKFHSKALHQHWDIFFASSATPNQPSLNTMLQSDTVSDTIAASEAIVALLKEAKPYLAIADDAPARSSFQSLSAKLGAQIGELHLAAMKGLSKAGNDDVRSPLLELARTLIKVTPYHRLSTQLLSPLSQVIANGKLKNDQTLRTIQTITRIQPQPVDMPVELLHQVATFLVDQESFLVQSLSCSTFTLISRAAPVSAELANSTIQKLLALPNGIWETYHYNCLAAVAAAHSRVWNADISQRVVSISKQTARGPTTELARIAAIAEMDLHNIHLNPIRILCSELTDGTPATTQSAVCQALGAIFKHDTFQPDSLTQTIPSTLLRAAEVDNITESALWAIANLLDVTPACLAVDATISSTILRYVEQGSSAMIRVNALRILAIIITPHMQNCVPALESCFQHSAPKVRWNAVITASKYLQSVSNEQGARQLGQSILCLLADKNLKVRIQAVRALSSSHLMSDSTLPKSVERALEGLEIERHSLPFSEAGHANQLKLELTRLQEKLNGEEENNG